VTPLPMGAWRPSSALDPTRGPGPSALPGWEVSLLTAPQGYGVPPQTSPQRLTRRSGQSSNWKVSSTWGWVGVVICPPDLACHSPPGSLSPITDPMAPIERPRRARGAVGGVGASGSGEGGLISSNRR
jgi:hypothetical protein